jgi:hypothetical protein
MRRQTTDLAPREALPDHMPEPAVQLDGYSMDLDAAEMIEADEPVIGTFRPGRRLGWDDPSPVEV